MGIATFAVVDLETTGNQLIMMKSFKLVLRLCVRIK